MEKLCHARRPSADLGTPMAQNIIKEEGEGAVIVLMRVGDGRHGKEKPIGYLYSYLEKWGEDSGSDMTHRRTRRHCAGGDSVYIAELFVVAQERGLGLGELLLAESLRLRCVTVNRSHLYVSSRNVSAVACYLKFGFGRSTTPSGDVNHDLVMELHSSQRSVMNAAHRMEQRLGSMHSPATRCPAKVTPPASPRSGYVSSASSSRASPMLSAPPSPSESGLHRPWKSLPPPLSGKRHAEEHRLSSSPQAHIGRGRITRGMAQQLRSGCVVGGEGVPRPVAVKQHGSGKIIRTIGKQAAKGKQIPPQRGGKVRAVVMLAMTYLKWGVKPGEHNTKRQRVGRA